jgi:hypothetical protein
MTFPVINKDIRATFVLRSGAALGLEYLPDIGAPICRKWAVKGVATLLNGAVDCFGEHGAASLHGQN